ncbi:hypothetical protein AVEN_169041-1 [Araneus ventricosus]|uniref:Uncharacterized protein n=1 Tax=Araneus ventricosus TaxID=182803 RepID=A0A4Y2H1P8_ARAVE|nr:hypothetical protein AVEN_169041-1 [Araneus ventricosus]
MPNIRAVIIPLHVPGNRLTNYSILVAYSSGLEFPCFGKNLQVILLTTYLHRFNLRTHDNYSCGEKEDPMHYATKCRFTLSWHFQTPTVSLKLQWLKNILTNNLSRTRLRLLMRFICDENNLIVEDNN